MAAGTDKLMVVLCNTKILQRWSLTTFEREATVALEIKARIVSVAMGSASEGPLFIAGSEQHKPSECVFIDIHQMRKIDLKADRQSYLDIEPEGFVRASGNGKVFASFNQFGLQSCELVDGEVRKCHGARGLWPVPGPDGRVIYTFDRGRHTTELKQIGSELTPCVPAYHGPCYLCLVRGRPGDTKGVLSVHLTGDNRPLGKLTDVDGLTDDWIRGYGVGVSFDKAIHLIPDAKLLITIPPTNDRLFLRRFDLDDLLAKSDIDYLLVVSQPPQTVVRGESFRYQLAIKSKKGGAKAKLESGPKEMSLSPEGLLTWAVPKDLTEKEVDVIVSVSDATGQETVQRFQLEVRGKTEIDRK